MALLSVAMDQVSATWSDEGRPQHRFQLFVETTGAVMHLTEDQFEKLGAVITRLHEMHLTRNMKIRSE